MIILGIAIALIASALLLAGGYLIGSQKSSGSNEETLGLKEKINECSQVLRHRETELKHKQSELSSVKEILALKEAELSVMQTEAKATTSAMRDDLSRISSIVEHISSDRGYAEKFDVQMLRDLVEAQSRSNQAQERIEELLKPVVKNDRLADELAELLPEGSQTSRDLESILNSVAKHGRFRSILLSDDGGLPLAASKDSTRPEAMAGVAALLIILAERIPRHGFAQPTALIVHDKEEQISVNCVFKVNDRNYLLTVLTDDPHVTPDHFDPIISRISALLDRSKRA